jgi:hypothetical protein
MRNPSRISAILDSLNQFQPLADAKTVNTFILQTLTKTRLTSRDKTSSCVIAFVPSRLVLLLVFVLRISRPTAVENSPSPRIVPENYCI